MKERPILFSAPMVRAILDGLKTQTRRVCKPAANLSYVVACQDPGTFAEGQQPVTLGWFGDEEGDVQFCCPYGAPGDQLWVREAWRITGEGADDKVDMFGRNDVQYRADDDQTYISKYRPSIHMPRRLSRITLRITSVKVERLQDISATDCIAEGIPSGKGASQGTPTPPTPSEHYRNIWIGINGPGSWDANPWVWVVGFERVTP